jgi:glycosyltransferase involved in cell wall biosynthesis
MPGQRTERSPVTELLSVVIPTHDRPDRLAEAVRSVLDQDYRSLEIVIVDDGSGPSTAEVLDRLTSDDDRVVALRNDESLGASAARNRGVGVARGELVGFCDDDDLWLPGAARAVVNLLGPEVGMVYGQHQRLIEHSGRLVTYRPPADADAELMRWINVLGTCFGVARRDRVGDQLHFDTDLITSEDWDMWLRCAEVAPMRLVPSPLYRYIQHGDERITTLPTSYAEGYHRFLAKHRDSMTPACIAHHELTFALATHDRNRVLAQLRQGLRRPSILGAAAMVGAEVAAGRRGRHTGDPGLPLRLAASILDGTPSRRRSTRRG